MSSTIPRGALLVAALGAAWLAWLFSLPARPSMGLVVITGTPLLLLASKVTAVRRAEGWMSFIARTADIHALLAVLLLALGTLFEDTHGITTDGAVYFSQLRSLIFDRDLDVAAEFAYLEQPPRPNHVVQIGPTIVWLPLYLAVAAIDAAGRTVGLWSAPADPVALGLTLPYVRAALISSFVIGAIGMFAVHHRLRAEFGRLVAFCSSLLLFAATPLIWYMVYEPSMTHAVSFGAVALFVTFVTRPAMAFHVTPRDAMVAGALLGLAFITRPQDAVFILLPAVLLFSRPEPLGAKMAAALRYAGYSLLGGLPLAVAQAVHTYFVLTREEYTVFGQAGYFDPFRARWADTLFSSWHGFFAWSPIAYVALIGTIFYVRRHKQFAIAALVILFLTAWVSGSTSDWGGWSFGGRRFVSSLVILAPGLALAIHALLRRPMWAMAMFAVLAIAWNQLLVAQYRSGMLPRETAMPFAQLVRQQAAVYTRAPYFYPFAFPANAWFAWRHNLPIDRYDLLGPEPFRPAIDVSFEAAAGRFLLEGWGHASGDRWGSLWWIDGEAAELTLPLKLPASGRVRVDVQARTRLVEPVVNETLVVRVNGTAIGTFIANADQPSTATLSSDGQIWLEGYNRIRFERTSPGRVPVGIYRISVTPE